MLAVYSYYVTWHIFSSTTVWNRNKKVSKDRCQKPTLRHIRIDPWKHTRTSIIMSPSLCAWRYPLIVVATPPAASTSGTGLAHCRHRRCRPPSDPTAAPARALAETCSLCSARWSRRTHGGRSSAPGAAQCLRTPADRRPLPTSRPASAGTSAPSSLLAAPDAGRPAGRRADRDCWRSDRESRPTCRFPTARCQTPTRRFCWNTGGRASPPATASAAAPSCYVCSRRCRCATGRSRRFSASCSRRWGCCVPPGLCKINVQWVELVIIWLQTHFS